jgi:hypothetical protein
LTLPGGHISVSDGATNAVTGTIALASSQEAATGVAVNTTTHTVYAFNTKAAASTVSVIDPVTAQTTNTVPLTSVVGPGPAGFTPDGVDFFDGGDLPPGVIVLGHDSSGNNSVLRFRPCPNPPGGSGLISTENPDFITGDIADYSAQVTYSDVYVTEKNRTGDTHAVKRVHHIRFITSTDPACH